MYKAGLMEKEGNEERKGLTNMKTCGNLDISQARKQTPDTQKPYLIPGNKW